MPRFDFNVRDGERHSRDDEGLDLTTIEDAREEASRAIAAMIRDAMPDGGHRDMATEVLGEDKHPILTVQVTFQVEIHGPTLPNGIRRLSRSRLPHAR